MTSKTDIDFRCLGAILRALATGGSCDSAYPVSGVAVGLLGTTVHIRTTHGGKVHQQCPRRTLDLAPYPEAERARRAKAWLEREVVDFAASVRVALQPPPPADDRDWWDQT